jgi:hypothetical protein
MTGHDQTEWAVTMVRNTHLDALGDAFLGAFIGFADIATACGEVVLARGIDPPLHAMGLGIDLAQEAPDRVLRNAVDDLALDNLGGQVRLAPARKTHAVTHRRLAGEGDERTDLLGGEGRRRTGARLIALRHRLIRSFAPALHQRATDLQARHRLADVPADVSLENDPRSEGQLLWCLMLTHQRL